MRRNSNDGNHICTGPAAGNLADGDRHLPRGVDIGGVIDDLPSYFMACLVVNVPDGVITSGYSLDDGFRATLVYLIVGLCGDNYKEEDREG
jgi:hypothetical protein